jgi:hypothetical protein
MDRSTLVQRNPPNEYRIIKSIDKETDEFGDVYRSALATYKNMTTPTYLSIYFDRELLMRARFRYEAAIRDMFHPMIVDDVLYNSHVLDMIKEALTPEE